MIEQNKRLLTQEETVKIATRNQYYAWDSESIQELKEAQDAKTLESLASKGEIREQVEEFLEQYRFGTMRKGDWLTTTEALNKILSIVNADKELALREQAERIKEQIIEAIDNYDGDYPDSYERGRLLPAFCDGVDMAKAAIQAFKKQVLEQ